MKQYMKIFVFLIILIIPFSSISGQFRITKVLDGNTVKTGGHSIEIKIRLVGIDAPETSKSKRTPGQPYSQQAKRYLTGLVLNKMVDVIRYGLDPYDRMLGVIHIGSKNINLEMVKAGLAEVYRGKPPKGFDLSPYLDAEENAKKAGKGMWSQGDKYVSPKNWRKRH